MGVIKSIKMKNFKSFGNSSSTFEFKNGMTLIKGKNAQGKSTTIQALEFGLFGKVQGFKLNDLINNINKKNLEVEVIYENDSTYKIRRNLAPKKFEIYKDGKLLQSNSSTKIDQEFLEKDILGINYSSFKQLISLDGSLITRSLINMSKGDRKEFIENILDIKILKYINNLAKGKLNHYKTMITECEYKINSCSVLINSELEHNEKIQRINNKLKNEGVSIQEGIQKDIKISRDKINKLNSSLDIITDLEKTLNDLEDKSKDLDKELQNKKKKAKTDYMNLCSLQEKNKTFNLCMGCEKLHKVIGKIDISEDNIKKEKDKLKEIKFSIQEKEKEKTEHIFKIQNLSKKISKKHTYAFEIEQLKEKIKRLQYTYSKAKNYSIIETDLSKIDELNKELKEIKDSLNEYTKYKNIYNTVIQLVSDNGIKKQIFMKYIPIFNSNLKLYSSEFGLDYNVFIDENFEIKLLDASTERNYNTFSASERLRLSLVIIFSFIRLIEIRNSFKSPILMIDELLDSSLSMENVIIVLDFLKNTFSSEKEIIIISHRDLDKEMFDRIFEIRKEENFSKIKRVE